MLNTDTNNTGVSKQARKPALYLDTWLDLIQTALCVHLLKLPLFIVLYTIQSVSKQLHSNKQENNDQ